MATDSNAVAIGTAEPSVPVPHLGGRLVAFYCMYFATLGVMLPFWPLWLASRHLSAAEVGLVLAASFWVQILSKPLISNLADRSGKHRAIMECLPLIALVGYACFPAVSGLGAFLVLAVLVGGTYPVLLPLGESLALHTAARHRVSYGRIRAAGSVAAIAASLLVGQMIAIDGPARILGTIAFGVAATAATCSLLPEVERNQGVARERSLQPLLNPSFLLFLFASGITQASHATFVGFSSIHWHAAGHSELWIGALWGLGISAEITLFLCAERISRRVDPLTLILIGAASGIVRWTLMASTTDLRILALAQLLQGATFGATHLGAMNYMRHRVPEHLGATAMGVYTASIAGVGFGALMPLSGFLYSEVEGSAFLLASTLCLVGLAFTLTLRGRAGRIAREAAVASVS